MVFSAFDNVRAISERICDKDGSSWIDQLADGSVEAHCSGKVQAGEYAMHILKDVPGLFLTILMLPFLHSNFLGFATPLPDEGKTQWSISVGFGIDSKVDMFSITYLAYIVPNVFDKKDHLLWQ